jgi:hypothetical protein
LDPGEFAEVETANAMLRCLTKSCAQTNDVGEVNRCHQRLDDLAMGHQGDLCVDQGAPIDEPGHIRRAPP